MTGTDATRNVIAGTAIVTLCCSVAVYFPVVGFISFLMLPLPILFYRVKLGRSPAGLIAAGSLIIIAMISGGWKPDIWLMLGMLGQGFLLGEFMEKDFPVEKTIAYSSGAVLLAGFFLLMVIGNLAGSGGLELLSAYIRKNLEMTATVYRQLDMPEENIRLLTDSLDQIHYVLLRVMPALMASGLLFAAWVNLLLGRATLRANRLHTPDFGRLNVWQAPDVLVWGVIGCAMMLFLPIHPIKFIGLNILIVLLMIYLFQGLGIMSFYFERKNVPPLLRIMIYGIIALQQLLVILVIGLGFFDTWINFRRLGVGNHEHPSP